MLLPDLKLLSRVNQQWNFSGMDHIDYCADKNHFLSYPYPINYCYNSRGFRDCEWPNSLEQLANAIWCIGDSFTAGIGSPVAHTWPNRLAAKTGRRTINVSMDGASNEWISRVTQQICKQVQPKNIVVMWSYTHRRELEQQNLESELRRLKFVRSSVQQDQENFLHCKAKVDQLDCDVIHFTIPNFCLNEYSVPQCWQAIAGADWPSQPPATLTELESLPQWILLEIQNVHQCLSQIQETLALKQHTIAVKQQDLARDGHHFDLITADWVAEQAQNLLGIPKTCAQSELSR